MAYFVSQFIHFIFWRKYHVSSKKSQAPKLFKDILVIVVYLIAITVIIGYVFKKPLTGFWATSSITALIIGFALRNIILDLFSGIALQVEQPYSVADWIKVDQRFSNDPVVGEVMDINWRSTYVRTEENMLVVIPNSLITTQAVITNYCKDGLATRYEVYFTLDYSVPVARATRVLMAGALEANTTEGFVQEKEPQILVDKTNDLGVVYKVRYWIFPWQKLSPSRSRNVLQGKILEHLDSAGLTLAYPKEDIYHTTMPVRQLETDNEEDRIKLLSRIDLFSFLSKNEIEDLSRRLIRREIASGKDIVRIHENGESMFVLLEGLLDVNIMNDEGEFIKVAQVTPGSYFGEMSLLTGEKRSATVTSTTDSIIFEITRNSFNDILSIRNDIIEKISENIASRKNSNASAILDYTTDLDSSGNEFKLKLIKSIKSVFKIK
jgi:small-conductance mechanosensitive channel